MKPEHINKAIDTGLDNVLNNGLNVKVEIPIKTLISVSVAFIITAMAVMAASTVFKAYAK